MQQQLLKEANNQNLKKVIKKTFQIKNSAGKLLVEANRFNSYFFLIITYASVLKVDGALQISYPTPYNAQPTVLNLIPEIQISDNIAKRLSAQIKMPLVLSLNIELETNKTGEEELFHGLLDICRHMSTL